MSLGGNNSIEGNVLTDWRAALTWARRGQGRARVTICGSRMQEKEQGGMNTVDSLVRHGEGPAVRSPSFTTPSVTLLEQQEVSSSQIASALMTAAV